MNYTNQSFHSILQELPGEYKELFIEKSDHLDLRIMNGRVEPISSRETYGASLLLKNGKVRFFEAVESLENLEKLFESGKTFDAPIGKMNWEANSGDLSFVSPPDMASHLEEMAGKLTPVLEALAKKDGVTSTL